VISLAIHAVLLLALFWVPPGHKATQKRGDALIVELPNLQEPASRGTPAPEGDAPVPARPAPKAQPAPPAPQARPTPPARPPARVASKAEPRPPQRQAATATQPAPSVDRGDAPTAKSAPQADVAGQMTETAKRAAEQAKPEPMLPPAVTSAPPPSPPGPIAAVPAPRQDFLGTYRRGGSGGGTGFGGAGGQAIGRGGIVGEPVALDSRDNDVSDYLARIKRLIQQNWAYPCVKDAQTGTCEYMSTELVVEFGILKQGKVQYAEVRRASPYGIYDSYAVNAIKLASPFPPVPPAMMARMQEGSTGAAIVARFVYHVDRGITNVLH
jgi:TonB family protein